MRVDQHLQSSTGSMLLKADGSDSDGERVVAGGDDGGGERVK